MYSRSRFLSHIVVLNANKHLYLPTWGETIIELSLQQVFMQDRQLLSRNRSTVFTAVRKALSQFYILALEALLVFYLTILVSENQQTWVLRAKSEE